MEIIKFNDESVLFMFKGFHETLPQMLAETGGKWDKVLGLIESSLKGKSDFSKCEVAGILAYQFSFPEKFEDSEELKDLALLGSVLYWIESYKSAGTIYDIKSRLALLVNENE